MVVAPVRCGAQAVAKWPDERAAGPFLCHADFALATHPQLLAEMTELQQDVVRALRLNSNPEPIHLFLFDRETTYKNYVGEYFPNVPYRRALFIRERGPGMVFAYRSTELEVDLRHETTHAVLHAALPMVPLWLDEGLAEYFEVPAAERAYGHPHLTAVKWGVRLGRFPPIEQLEEISKLENMGTSQYRQAWAWAHFMLHGPPAAHGELVRYLDDIQAQVPPGQLSQRLRRSLPNLEKELAKHFTQWRR